MRKAAENPTIIDSFGLGAGMERRSGDSAIGSSGLKGGDGALPAGEQAGGMPLGLLQPGARAEIRQLPGGAVLKPCTSGSSAPEPDSLSCRMEGLGLRAGTVVEMLSNDGRGALVVKVDGTRLAISRTLAMRLMVIRRA